MSRYNKAGEPTTCELAEAIERMRDLLFNKYGDDHAFSIIGEGKVIAAGNPTANRIIHAVVREPDKG